MWDALQLAALGEHFDTVLDSGLYHVFDDTVRVRYVESLAFALPPGSRYFMLCFSERQPGNGGRAASQRTTSEQASAMAGASSQ